VQQQVLVVHQLLLQVAVAEEVQLKQVVHQLLFHLLQEEQQVLEALADALTSLEYYIESIGKREERNPDLLRLAESSLDDVGL